LVSRSWKQYSEMRLRQLKQRLGKSHSWL
jgi:hypothetical protein